MGFNVLVHLLSAVRKLKTFSLPSSKNIQHFLAMENSYNCFAQILCEPWFTCTRDKYLCSLTNLC